MHEAYTANRMSADPNIYLDTWPVVTGAVIQRFLTKHILQETHDLLTQASYQLEEDKIEFETRYFKLKDSVTTFFSCEESYLLRS